MRRGIKQIAWAGVIASVAFIALDLYASVKGFNIIFTHTDKEDPLAVLTPIFFALLCGVMNGLTGHILKMYQKNGFTTFSTSVVVVIWALALTYDVVSSFVGLLDTYSGVRVDSVPAIIRAIRSMSGLGVFVVLVVSLVLSVAPLLFTIFYELATEPD